MKHADDELGWFFGEDKEPSQYTRRVAELLRRPGVAELWRRRCQESFQESRKRLARHKAWVARRDKAVRKLIKKTYETVVSPINLHLTEQVRIYQTAERPLGEEPFAGGPLPFSPFHQLSLADC